MNKRIQSRIDIARQGKPRQRFPKPRVKAAVFVMEKPIYAATEREQAMEATAHVLSCEQCTFCHGTGFSSISITRFSHICRCVKRAVFQIVYRSFLSQTDRDATPRYEATLQGGILYSIPSVEFRVDFVNTARRVLDPFHMKLFRLYCLDGKSWQFCCAEMRCNRGHLFHSWYRVQEQVGHELMVMEPSMFPVAQYFQTHRHILPEQIPLGHLKWSTNQHSKRFALDAPLRAMAA